MIVHADWHQLLGGRKYCKKRWNNLCLLLALWRPINWLDPDISHASIRVNHSSQNRTHTPHNILYSPAERHFIEPFHSKTVPNRFKSDALGNRRFQLSQLFLALALRTHRRGTPRPFGVTSRQRAICNSTFLT